jgi:hypothetical protein
VVRETAGNFLGKHFITPFFEVWKLNYFRQPPRCYLSYLCHQWDCISPSKKLPVNEGGLADQSFLAIAFLLVIILPMSSFFNFLHPTYYYISNVIPSFFMFMSFCFDCWPGGYGVYSLEKIFHIIGISLSKAQTNRRRD